MIVNYDAQARTFTMTGQALVSTYPIAELPKWLAFYRMMKADYPKAKGAYDATVAALEALEKQLSAS